MQGTVISRLPCKCRYDPDVSGRLGSSEAVPLELKSRVNLPMTGGSVAYCSQSARIQNMTGPGIQA